MAEAGLVTKTVLEPELVERLVEKQVPVGVSLMLTTDEAKALVCLAGYIGGDPKGPRGLANDALNEIGAALYGSDYWGHYQSAQEDLGTTVAGALRFSPAPEC